MKNLKAIEGKKFLVIDSISTLLAYNKAEKIIYFLHALSSALPVLGADAVFIGLKNEESKALQQISSQFCDKVIKV